MSVRVRDGVRCITYITDCRAVGSTATVAADGYNIGIGGSTCKEVKKRAADRMAAFLPSWVVLVCGENDLENDLVRSSRATSRAHG